MVPVSVNKTLLGRRTHIGNRLSELQIRGWIAVSAEELPVKGWPKRTVFSQTPVVPHAETCEADSLIGTIWAARETDSLGPLVSVSYIITYIAISHVSLSLSLSLSISLHT